MLNHEIHVLEGEGDWIILKKIKSPLVFQLLYRKGFLGLFCIEIVSKDGDSFEISHINNLRWWSWITIINNFWLQGIWHISIRWWVGKKCKRASNGSWRCVVWHYGWDKRGLWNYIIQVVSRMLGVRDTLGFQHTPLVKAQLMSLLLQASKVSFWFNAKLRELKQKQRAIRPLWEKHKWELQEV